MRFQLLSSLVAALGLLAVGHGAPAPVPQQDAAIPALTGDQAPSAAAAAAVPSLFACSLQWKGTWLTGHREGLSCRYTVRYGTADRWAYSTPAASQSGQDAAQFPPMCPQGMAFPSAEASPLPQSEDCLFMTIYTPWWTTKLLRLPVFVWVHGGSYIQGSISDKGINGVTLAPSANIVAVFVQYRLGVLGFLPPPSAPTSADPNFGLRDVILALETVRDNIASAGGDKSKVTIGGQSSGASLIRALWGAPGGRGLYHRMILHSDPLTFGTQSPIDEVLLQNMVYTNPLLGNCADFNCWKAVDVDKLITVGDQVANNAPNTTPSIAQGEAYRPQFRTVTLPQDPTQALFNNPSNLAFDPASVPIMFTTTRNEAGSLIQGNIATPIPGDQATYVGLANVFIGNPAQTSTILGTGLYPVINGPDGTRNALDILLTDAVWRCPTRSVAGQLASRGAKVFVGEWTSGISYTYNQGGYCAQPDIVCHGDDLYPTFGSAPNSDPSSSLVSVFLLETSVRNAWGSFIRTGSPGNWAQWTATSGAAQVARIGAQLSIRECPTGAGAFGTTDNPFKWQVHSGEDVPVLGSGPTVCPPV